MSRYAQRVAVPGSWESRQGRNLFRSRLRFAQILQWSGSRFYDEPICASGD